MFVCAYVCVVCKRKLRYSLHDKITVYLRTDTRDQYAIWRNRNHFYGLFFSLALVNRTLRILSIIFFRSDTAKSYLFHQINAKGTRSFCLLKYVIHLGLSAVPIKGIHVQKTYHPGPRITLFTCDHVTEEKNKNHVHALYMCVRVCVYEYVCMYECVFVCVR